MIESNPVLNLGRRFETKALSSAYQLNSGLRLSHLHLQGIPLLEELNRRLDSAGDLFPGQIYPDIQLFNHQYSIFTVGQHPQRSHLSVEPELLPIVSDILGLSSISHFSSDSSHMKLWIFFAILF